MQGQQEAKRKRTSRLFDVVVVPSGDKSKPLRFSAGWWKIGLAAAGGVRAVLRPSCLRS